MIITTPCEYCGGSMQRKFTRIGVSGREPQPVERICCHRCGREQSMACLQCRTRTRPCLNCNGQRCECKIAGHYSHWYGTFRIDVFSSKGEGSSDEYRRRVR